ncbi:hypothetical protein A7U43_27955 (plasmid) [Mycobacterium adipatum]|uniref:Uncharacterized protein n=2 Tax=Mycobacterium adipatum TaxID=1682113 RepID=A0A172UWE8_9MYCO|nr:hypothetical protein A7U43_27955 [Mycobacterium adipatum]
MKFPRIHAPRPTPRMPELAGFEARYDLLPAVRPLHQPAEAIRPLHWWAKDLQAGGDLLVDARFDAMTMTATVSIRLSSYQVVSVVRHHDDKPQTPRTLADVLAESIWRLGSLGWSAEIEEAVAQLRAAGLMATPAKPDTRYLPGWVQQPDRGVRMAYWWAGILKQHGWKLYACGDAVARHGFIAEVPRADGESALVVYPGGMPDDGTAASALANHLARLGSRQRAFVQRVIGDAAAGEGRVV